MKHPSLVLLLASTLILVAGPWAHAELHEENVFEPIFKSRVFVTEAGLENRESVILIHGLGDNGARDWDTVIPYLAESYHVVAFDLPGFGRSEKKNLLYSPLLYAAFVKWAVDRYVDGEFSVVGHSMGGAVALRFAATYPKDLQRLVLVDVAGILHGAAFARFHAEESLERKLAGRSSASYDYLSGLTGAAIHRFKTPVEPSTLLGSPAFRKKILKADPIRIAALALIEEDFTRLTSEVTVPTLLIWGEMDKVAPPRVGWLLKAQIPDSRLRFMAGVGHVPMSERPEEFNQLLSEGLTAEWEQPPTPEPERSDRVGLCRGEAATVFIGSYDRIEIEGCAGATLLGVTATQIDVTDSTLEIMDSHIAGKGTALIVRNSTVRATNLSVSGETAILASDSYLDLAGAQVIGTAAAIRTEKKSYIIFSLSSVQSPFTSGPQHGAIKVKKNQQL